uniref:Delta(3)-Delta(2)-enoyl-CoA isomerase n=1 Tax=Davidia involucrata TaxID=16924 RepID=A0A5B7AJY3_DAVIN
MCTLEKRGSLFILTLMGNDEHRLNPTLIDAIKAALHQIRSDFSTTTTPSALITTAHGKFFSNGYDLAWAKTSDPASPTTDRLLLMSSKFRSLINDFISLPMPTIAAVSGHASAAGFILALCHDYVLMRKDRGFLYMSELDIGFKIPAWFMALVRCKIGSPMSRRDVVLRAAKLTAVAAAEKGIIDSAHDSAEETVKAAVRLGEELVGRKWDGHVYAQHRRVLFADVLGAIEFDETVEDVSYATKACLGALKLSSFWRFDAKTLFGDKVKLFGAPFSAGECRFSAVIRCNTGVLKK